MAADTRREKRAPVSLKVRFKSATVDEFIEQYSVDISVGGLFIKTKSPMPIGTLLKFEFQLKDESRLIHGVGRVVWKRDENEAKGSDVPAGMGIKFIKMDADSRATVDRIVAQRADVQSSFDMVAPAITTSMPPPGESPGVITIRPAAPAVPDEAMRSPVPSVAPPRVPSVAPKAAPRYKSTLAFDANVLPTPSSSKSTLAFDGSQASKSSPPPAPSSPPPASTGSPFFPSTTPADEMPDDADRTNIRPVAELRARAEAAEVEARKSDEDLRSRIEAARAPAEEEDVGRVTMPESDERRAARGKERAVETEDPKAALRRAAEEEARAERKAAAARHESDVVAKSHGIMTAEPASAKASAEDESEAETLPPVASKAAEIAASAAIPAPRAPSGSPELPPLDFDDPDESVTPAVLHTAASVSQAPEARESIDPRSGKKKKKKGKKGRGGESVRPVDPPKAARVSTPPAAAQPKASASTAIEKASADRKGPRLAVEDVDIPKKTSSGSSKTLPIVLAIVALGAAVGIYFWQSNPAPAPTATDVIADPSVGSTPTPSVPEVPPAPTPVETPPTPEAVVATAPVRIESVPAGGTIRFAGSDHGVTPSTVDLPSGVATPVTVALQGFAALTQEVTASAGATPVRFVLVPMPYTLIVDTVPSGARVTANGRSAVAPGAITLGRVTGPVQVTATKTGFDAASQEVTLNEFVEENGQLVRRLTLTLQARAAEAPAGGSRTPRSPSTGETSPTPAAATPAVETPPPPAAETPPAETPREEPPAERPAPPAAAEPLPENPF